MNAPNHRLTSDYGSTQRVAVVKHPPRQPAIQRTLLAFLSFFFLTLFCTLQLRAQNPIVTENQNPGTPGWNIVGLGDTTIMGYATDMSVNKGQRVHFKIKTNAASYKIDIYRLGYYQGIGGRKIGTGVVTATLPQIQPKGIYDPATGLLDCGNWSESAYWDVPSTAVSGVYIAKMTRGDNNGSQLIVFVVRDDASTSDLFFQTSDATWQAYNFYGDNGPGNSFYQGTTSYPDGRAPKISYNRPFLHGMADKDFVFRGEFAMIKWLEHNGYNVSYTTDMDSERRGELIKKHKVFMSVAHDEYWSPGQRANVEAARNAGVHLAFFSANECYWKTRWENSVDGTGTPYRTLVCYKEGTDGDRSCGGKCDPMPGVWTGTWRSGCEYNADGCKPENALSGQISYYATGTEEIIQVPSTYKGFRFWRNTAIANLASGQTASLAANLGFEFDYEQQSAYGSAYPAGRVRLSETTITPGIVNQMSLYRHSSGALVFGCGTIDWALALETDMGSGALWGATTTPDVRVQQATVNVLADMGTQPSSLQTGLVAAAMTTDRQPPVTAITSIFNGYPIQTGLLTPINGTATETGGVVAGVEVSTDGGETWTPATLTNAAASTTWSFPWTPPADGIYTIMSRAVDDMGNLETTSTSSNKIQVSTPGITMIPPVITCPLNISVNSDAGKCGALVTFAATATGSPLPLLTYKIGTQAITSPYTFPVGTTTVSVTAINNVLPNALCSFTVTVKDNIKPVVTPPAGVTLAYNSSGNYTIAPATATDECGIKSITYSISGATNRSGTTADASGSFAVGTSTITWTATDVNGNVSTATTTVVVNPLITNIPPTVTCPANITDVNDAGKCSALNTFAATATGTPKPTLIYKIGTTVITSPYAFPVGTSTVSVTASNGVSPNATCSFTVKITDAEKPVLTTPANTTFTYSSTEQYKLAAATAKDNCGVKSITYSISGATNRSGTTADASGSFAVGTSTITWTATDVNGNVSTATTTVVVNPSATEPIVSITDATIYESQGSAVVTVKLSQPSTDYVALYYKTVDGTAKGSTSYNPDYVPKQGYVIFPPGTVSQTIVVPVYNNPALESTEYFYVQTTLLYSPKPVKVRNSVAKITVLNGKGSTQSNGHGNTSPSVCISDAIVYESSNIAQLTVKLSKASRENIVLDYSTVDGTATGGGYYPDFVHVDKARLVIPAGALNATITVNLRRDRKVVSGKYFFVEISKHDQKANAVITGSSDEVELPDPSSFYSANTSNLGNKQVDASGVATQGLQISAYPNPSTDVFRVAIQSSNNAPIAIRLIDVNGRVLETYQNVTANNVLELGSRYRAGTYLVEAVQGTERKTLKLIKQGK